VAHVSLVAARTLGKSKSAAEGEHESDDGDSFANLLRKTSWSFDSNKMRCFAPARDSGDARGHAARLLSSLSEAESPNGIGKAA
jgi:hypothetical protein